MDTFSQQAPSLRRLSDGAVADIHFATLEILERTGVRFYDEEAVALLKKAGANVSEGNLVRIPSHLIEWAIRTAPKRIPMVDRNGRQAMVLQGNNSYFGPGSDCPFILDHRSGERRQPNLSDVIKGMNLCDYLPNIDFVMSMFIPSDVPVPVSDRYQMEAMLLNTTKPIVYVTHDIEGCKDAVEMAEVIAGGADALRTNPLACCYINITAPLRHNQEAIQKLMFLAKKGLPSIYCGSNTTRGVVTPSTAAAAVALGNAGALAGLLLAQLVREGAPVIVMRTGGGGLDMRTMVSSYASPETQGYRGDISHHYGLPIFGMAGCSDSKLPDEQALAEASLTLLVDALMGANLIHDVGYIEYGLTNSLEMLAMCNDVIGWIRRFMEPQPVSRETLALDVIHEAGPDGEYLDAEHTLRHFKEEWYPSLMNRAIYDNWMHAGAKTYRAAARDRVEQVLETHRCTELDVDTKQRIHAVLERAAARAGVRLV